MGLRFHRSVRLFPGVRLNFSGGGISTTIGVRGASVNVGTHGTYLNLGLPGTGISYRTRISPDAHAPPPRIDARPEPHVVPGELALGEHEIRSADVSVLTSPGLGELKRLINEASAERARLRMEVARDEAALVTAKRKLSLAKMFIVRLFTKRMIPRLTAAVHSADEALVDARSRLEGCGVEIDFAFEEATAGSYAALLQSFNELRSCGAIWDITSTSRNNRFVERTFADYSVTRKPVQFDLVDSDLIRTKFRAMRLGNVTGLDIHIYPGFLMMRDLGGDFALIEFKELAVGNKSTKFLEEEHVPFDSQVVGNTWKKANKDGTRDRRFNGNFQIPLALYGELTLKSPTGLLEAYMVSNAAKTHAFALALATYQKALADLAARSTHAPAEIHQLPPPADHDAAPQDVVDVPPAATPEPPKNMVLDWIGLVVIVLAIAAGGYWGVQHREVISAAFVATGHAIAARSPAVPTAAVATSAPQPAPMPAREVVYVQKSGVNVRSEPSTAGSVVGAERKGEQLAVFGRQGQWTQVGKEKPVGWIYSALLGTEKP